MGKMLSEPQSWKRSIISWPQEPVPIHLICLEHRPDINLWLFHKEKFDSDGKFIKGKYRIVTLSQVRDTSKIGHTDSPTVNPISLFMVLAKAATLPKCSISVYDVKAAFLKLSHPRRYLCTCQSRPRIIQDFCEGYPTLKQMLNGTPLTFRLRRYLYGLQESPLA